MPLGSMSSAVSDLDVIDAISMSTKSGESRADPASISGPSTAIWLPIEGDAIREQTVESSPMRPSDCTTTKRVRREKMR